MKNKFVERFTELINDCRVKQTDLARKLKVCYKQIGRWKKGIAEPKIDDIFMLADYFDVSIDYLLGRTDYY